MQLRSIVICVVAAIALATPEVAQAFPPYRAHAMIVSGAQSEGFATNQLGEMVGQATNLPGRPGTYGFEWFGDGPTEVVDPLAPEPPSFQDGRAVAVNDREGVVGWNTYTFGSACRGWAFINQKDFALGSTQPVGINNSGVVVGRRVDNACTPTGVGFYSLQGATPANLGSALYGVNNHGVVIGVDTTGHGATWQLGANAPAKLLIPLPPGASTVTPMAINGSSGVVGDAFDSNGDPIGIFFYRVGNPTSRMLPVPTDAEVNGYNNLGDVLYTASSGQHLFNVPTSFDLAATPASLLGPGTPYTSLALNSVNDGLITGQEQPDARALYLVMNPPSFPADPLPQPHPGQIPASLQIPLTIQWVEQAAAGVPIHQTRAQVSADRGNNWHDVTLRNAAVRSFTINFKPATATLVQVSATDDLGQFSSWHQSPFFTADLIDDAAAGVSYTSGWTAAPDANAADGTLSETSISGAAATFSFTGEEVEVVGRTGPGMGSATLMVDGASKGTVNFASATAGDRMVIAAASGLSAGSHTVELVANGDGQIDLDGFTTVSY
jgi:hypothetical protein